jgi:hypothetical protein
VAVYGEAVRGSDSGWPGGVCGAERREGRREPGTRGGTRGAWSSHRRYAGRDEGRTWGAWNAGRDAGQVELDPTPCVGTLMRVGSLMQCGMGNGG